MCKSLTQGGQRCAAHTRPPFENATFGTPEWDKAAADFASTPTGRIELSEALVAAQERTAACTPPPGRTEGYDAAQWKQAMLHEIALTRALEQGERLREATRDTASSIADASLMRDENARDRELKVLSETVFTLAAGDFAERFGPGEYQRSGAGWDEVADHPAFLEENPFNSDRIHEGTWDAFVADVARNGIAEPVSVDSYSEELAEGHHRVVAALRAGQPIRFRVDTTHDGGELARTLIEQGFAEPVIASPVAPDTGGWDYGTPNTEVAQHWSIAEGGDRWHAGGCGAFAIALTERWPHLKIAAEMYHDHGAESVAHAWAYDPATNTRFHIFGAEQWEPTTRPDYDPDSHRVLLDQNADDVRRLFRGFNTSEDTVFDAMEVVCEQFDPHYEPDPDAGDRNYLYFW